MTKVLEDPISPRVLSTNNSTCGHFRKLLKTKEIEKMFKAVLERYVFLEKP